MPLTEQGKKVALAALAKRRANKPTFPDDAALPAGSPIHLPCLACGAIIEVPEGYIYRPKLCTECKALNDLGWLE